MHQRRRPSAVTQRLAALTLPVAITIGSVAGGPAVFAAESDIDRAFDTLGLPPAMEQVRSQVLAILGDALDRNDADDDAEDPPALRLENALRRWELMAPDWRAMPQSVMERLRLCRDVRLRDPGAAVPEGCGDELRLELRLRHMEQAESRFQQRLDAADGDATALGDLDRLQERVMERIAEVDAAMDQDRDRAMDASGLGDGDLEQIRDRIMEQDMDMEREMDRVRANGGQP
jgi:hypothetical protein